MNLLNPREPINTWSHALWLIIALAGMILLWQRGQGDRAKQISLFIYGVSLIFCSACSTLYHGVRLPGERIRAFAMMDHVGIYMLIAGTYTPIAWTFLRRHWRRGVLGLVWFWACAGHHNSPDVRNYARLAPHGVLPGHGMGRSLLLLRGGTTPFPHVSDSDRRRRRALQSRSGFQSPPRACSLARSFWGSRALPRVRRGRQHVPLLLHSHRGRAVGARFAV